MYKVWNLGICHDSVFSNRQRGIGNDSLYPVSQPSVSRCIAKVTTEIVRIFAADQIRFPRNRLERAKISDE